MKAVLRGEKPQDCLQVASRGEKRWWGLQMVSTWMRALPSGTRLEHDAGGQARAGRRALGEGAAVARPLRSGAGAFAIPHPSSLCRPPSPPACHIPAALHSGPYSQPHVPGHMHLPCTINICPQGAHPHRAGQARISRHNSPRPPPAATTLPPAPHRPLSYPSPYTQKHPPTLIREQEGPAVFGLGS